MEASLKKIALWGFAGFFLIAGVNHFLMPKFYFPLIPDYLPAHGFINVFSGLLEIAFAIMLLIKQTRKMAGWGIAILMVLFVPSHIYFIQIGSCVEDGLCVEPWIAWVRLILVQPIFIVLAIYFSKVVRFKVVN
jgi:uncharacterized membrane protein